MARASRITLPAPEGFDLDLTVRSHGWCDLPPFRWDAEGRGLHLALRLGGTVHQVRVRSTRRGLTARLDPVLRPRDRSAARRRLARVLSLDQDLREFHRLCRDDEALAWAARRGAGRLLRAPTVWEDLVKVLCTTNCSWSLTRAMVSRLVEEAGTPGPGGHRAFPGPQVLARRSTDWFKDRVRAGYRAEYLSELSRRVADAELDPESWDVGGETAEIPREEVAEALDGIRGVGRYARELMLRLLGYHQGLALDSWCRRAYYDRYHEGRPVRDSTIRRRYRSYGEYAGLALWLDLTRPEGTC